MKKFNKFISMLLIIAMTLTFTPFTSAVNAEENHSDKIGVTVTPSDGTDITADLTLNSDIEKLYSQEDEQYSDDEVVRAIIVLNEEPVVQYEKNAADLTTSPSARSAMTRIEGEQSNVQGIIERDVLQGRPLNVEYKYSYALNGIAASITYGELKEIRQLKEVKYAVVSEQYQLYPMTASSSGMVGAQDAWAENYRGEGMRIAIVDTGIDTDHPSFAANGVDMSASDNYLAKAEIGKVLYNLKAFNMGGNGGAPVGVSTLYLSDKIPFAFNYVDAKYGGGSSVNHDATQSPHGSHVAGIAAANELDTTDVVGIAPKAQLLVMKVFGANGGAYASDIIASIEDAMVLNSDVINLSLGTDGGFTNDSPVMEEVLERVASTDVVICMAAGNNSSSARGNERLTDTPLTENPDNGIVGSPGTFVDAFSVASLDNSIINSKYVEIGSKKISITDSKNIAAISTLAGKATKYVIIGNPETGEGIYGTKEDFDSLSGGDFSDAIAIVSRGETLFSDKHLNAANAGFAGIIIYNNKNGIFAADVSESKKTIAAGTITANSGAYILSQAVYDSSIGAYAGNLRVSETAEKIPSETAWAVSDFSSCGTTADLKIKPEIAGVGGNIYSAVDKGEYAVNSGTSMACPQVAGVSALVLQYLREEYPNMNEIEYRVIAQSLLMSTANIVMSNQEDKIPYSPRNQGAGLVNALNAVKSKAYLSVEGSEKPKVELGDDKAKSGVYKVTFDVNNLSKEPLNYKLKTYTLTEDHFVGPDGLDYMAQVSKALNPNVEYKVTAASTDIALDFSADKTVDSNDIWMLYNAIAAGTAGDAKWQSADFNSDEKIDIEDIKAFLKTVNRSADYDLFEGDNAQITVPAGGATVTATITLSDEDRAYMDSVFENGIYVDGFVKLEAVAGENDEDVVDLNVPFLAFYGDWTRAAMIDNTYVADYANYGEREMYFPNIIWTGNTTYLGVNAYAEDNEYIPERSNVISPDNTTPSQAKIINDYYLALLRNARNVTTTVTDDEGNVLWENNLDYVRKACYSPADDLIVPVSWKNEVFNQIPFWPTAKEDTDNGDKLTLKISAELDYGNAQDQDNVLDEIIIPMRVDEIVPTLDEKSLDLVYKPLEGEKGTKTLSFKVKDDKYVAAVVVFNSGGTKVLSRHAINQTEPGVETALTIDVSEAKSKIKLAVCDYGSNISYYDIDFNIGDGGSEFDTTKLFGYRLPLPGRAPAWITFDSEDYSNPTIVYDDSKEHAQYIAAEYYEDNVYAVDKNNNFYAMPFENIGNTRTKIASLGFSVGDMAYDYFSNRMLGLADSGAAGNGFMSVVVLDHKDVLPNKDYEVAFKIAQENNNYPLYLISMACTTDGDIYGIGLNQWEIDEKGKPVLDKDKNNVIDNSINGNLYYLGKYNDIKDNMGTILNAELVGNTGYSPNTIQSMAYDHNTDKLYWAKSGGSSTNFLGNMLEIVMEEGKVVVTDGKVKITDLGKTADQVTGLFVPYMHETSGDPVVEIKIEQNDKLNLIKGEAVKLSVQIVPWTADKGIVWSSEDESVVSVDQTGVITAVSTGSAIITATAKTDSGKFDTVTVTVKDLTADIGGYAISRNSDGSLENMLYGWTEFSTDNITPLTTGADKASITAGTRVGDELHGFNVEYKDEKPYLNLQKFDMDGNVTSGAAISLGEIFNFPKGAVFGDMAYSVYNEFYAFVFSKSIYTSKILPKGKYSPLNGIDLTKFIDSKSTAIVSIAYDNKGVPYCIDDIGNLYKLTMSSMGGVNAIKKIAKTNVGTTWSKGLALSSMCYNSENGMLYFAQAQSTGLSNAGIKLYAIDPTDGSTFSLGSSSDIVSFSGIYIK